MSLLLVDTVSEVVQTLQLSGAVSAVVAASHGVQPEIIGDLSVCLDGMTVDPEMFASAAANHQSKSI